jgi:cell division septation protein DedD
MASSSQDTEITLGTTKLLVLFFGLVAICALFFALGYSLGRKAEPGITTANASPQITPGGTKPAGAGSAPPMTFYKAVEQKDANGELTPAASDPKSVPKADTPANPSNTGVATDQSAPAPANSPDPTTTLPTGGYSVQVAAVSKQEDAEALVDALKKKQYPASANTASTDKFFHVQVGPFSDIKEAEAMRARLISDGYNPILKK